MAYAANALGLKEIAITDHGFRHICGTSKQKLKKARQIIDEINTWSTTKVLLGIEADIISEDGTIDVDNETLTMIDILVVGYHKMIKTDFAGYFGKVEKTKEAKDRCTRAFLNAINRYPVNIISHLDSVLTTDLYEIGVACRERGTLIEINNRHTNWNQDQIDELLASGCLFTLSSDAHRREDVGVVDKAFEIVKKYDIPSEYIVNVEFEFEEKSENDKEREIAFSLYRKKEVEQAEEEAKKEETKRYEYTETLSPEMEKALADIAKEQGLQYVNKNETNDGGKSANLEISGLSEEDIAALKRAHEILAGIETPEETVEETENVAISAEPKEDDFNVVEEDETDYLETLRLLKGVRPRDLLEAIEMQQNAEPEAETEGEAEPQKTEEQKKPATAEEILKALAEVKSAQSNVKDETAPKQKIVMKIEKNAPTTRKPVQSQGKPKIVDVDVESMAQKPAKPAEQKPAKTRKSYGGFIGGSGGLVGLSEANQKKTTSTKNDK